jgi:type I restriction enzyme S subunit
MRCADTAVTWSRVPLGDLCEFVRGVTFDGGEASLDPRDGCLPILRAGNISETLDLESDLVWVPAERVSPKQLLRAGDIAICMSSGSPAVVGKSASLPKPFSGSVGAFCGIVRPRDLGWSEYVALWLRSPAFMDWRDGQARGANIQNLRFSQFESLAVPRPPDPERDALVSRLRSQLGAAARMRAAVAAQLATADRLNEAELRDAFRGILPLAVGGARGLAPVGWEWHLLADLARLESGHTPSRRHPEWWGGTIPWLALPDIRALDGKVVHETTETTNELGIANSSARVLPEGTVVLSRTASVGFVAMMGRPMATSQDFVNWVCGPDLDPTFLMYLLRTSREYIRQLSSGAIHKTVYVPTVKAFAVCVPEVAEQRRIAAKVHSRLATLAEIRTRLDGQTADIGRLPAASLRSAFSGDSPDN